MYLTKVLKEDKGKSIILLIALLWSFSNLIFSTYNYNWPSGDEAWHFSYSERYLNTGETERESVHNYNSTTPSVVLNVLSNKLIKKITDNNNLHKVASRLPNILWYIVLLYACGYLAYLLGGVNLAWWAIFLTSLDPSLNAHAGLIGTDLPFSAISLCLLTAIINYINRPSIISSALLGLIYGLSFLVKYSATFLVLPIALGFIIVFIKKIREKDNPDAIKNLFLISIQLLIAIIFCILIINAAYSFSGVGQSLSIKTWYSKPFLFLLEKFGDTPLPFAIPFLSGFDHQFAAERSWSWNVVILGQHFPNGIWYYFLVNWFFKTTTGVILIFLACLLSIFNILAKVKKINPAWLIIVTTWCVLLFYFSFIFRTQVGLRYAFPCLPLSYIIASGVIVNFWPKISNIKIASAILFIALVELMPYFGNGISFTNSFIIDKKLAYQYLADSNIDWFHNEDKARTEADKKLKNYVYDPIHILPGYNLITLNRLTGVMHNFDQFKWVRDNLTPIAHFEHTLLAFYLSTADFEKYKNQHRTFEEPANARKICIPQYKYQDLNQLPNPIPGLFGSWSQQASLYSGCLEVSEDATFEVNIKGGWSVVGVYPNELDCQGWPGGNGTSLWFKFKKGIHPICAYVNDALKAEWKLIEGKAKFAYRILP